MDQDIGVKEALTNGHKVPRAVGREVCPLYEDASKAQVGAS